MNQPYQLILDIWEGNPQIDIKQCLENGVAGLIVRLNDMSGGHHMDTRFDFNWETAKQFPEQTLYFVYNPWVSGKTNYDWCMAHMPDDFGKRRLFVDIEVRYPGYSPSVYAVETRTFMRLVRQHFPATRYSGGGYLDILAPWPKDEEYWWAAYPDALKAAKTWDEYKSILANLSFTGFTKLSPGPCRMWQSSGDGVKMPGFGGHAVDICVFPGTREDLSLWFKEKTENHEDPFRPTLENLATRLSAVENALKQHISGQ